MKLKDCNIGTLVITNSNDDRRIMGHIIGVTYNIDVSQTGGMDREDLLSRTIPLIRWSNGTESSIHHNNISVFKG